MLAYETHGSGEPLVLVHGLATTRVIWRRVIPLLDRRIIAIDVPGFGASPPVGEGFDLEAVADHIAAQLPEARYDLVGHSLGGAITIVLAERHPEAVERLVLVAPAGLRRLPRAAARIAGAVTARAIPLRRRGAALADMPWGRRLLMGPGTADPTDIPPAEVRAMLAASEGATRIAEALEAAASADLRSRLEALPMPVALIWGERDRIIPAAETALRIPGTGHIPMMERPEAFVAALEQALSPDGNTARALRS